MGTWKCCSKGSKNLVRKANATNRPRAPVGKRSSNWSVLQLTSRGDRPSGRLEPEGISTEFFLHRRTRRHHTSDTTTFVASRGAWYARGHCAVGKSHGSGSSARGPQGEREEGVIFCDKHLTHHRAEPGASGSARPGLRFFCRAWRLRRSSPNSLPPSAPKRTGHCAKPRILRRIS